MALHLHFHPLSSYCWKVLIALYENDTPFERHIVDLGNETSRAEFVKLWPIAKMPVLRDDARGVALPESSIIIEYLDLHYPGGTRFLPGDADLALQTRLRDRFFDLYVHDPMQRIVGDRLRSASVKDPHGVEQAKARLGTAYAMIEQDMAARNWAMGDDFTLADCAAAPALFYADKVLPFGATHPQAMRYLERLKARPSFARAIEEAKPYFALFPQ
jgi:glutathione S-transferase